MYDNSLLSIDTTSVHGHLEIVCTYLGYIHTLYNSLWLYHVHTRSLTSIYPTVGYEYGSVKQSAIMC